MTGEGVHFRGDILIDGPVIAKIGPDLSGELADEVRNCAGMAAIPGLVNAHTHLSMVLMRNYKDTCSNLQDWLSEIFPIEDRLDEEDIYWASLLGLAELAKSGCSSFADMYFKQWKTAQACKESGMRGFLSLTLFGDAKETEKRLAASGLLDAELTSPLLRKDIAVHAIYTCTDDTYRLAAEQARENGLVVNTHLSETKKEMDDCLSERGMLPSEWIDKTGFFDVPCYVAHGVWLQDREAELLARKNVSVVHNPSSNCKLASGIAPVRRFMDMGLNVGLGTDGASSNNNLSMVKEMRLAAMISTASTMDVAALPPYKVLKMATINSARAIHADKTIGSLEPGKDADITLVNLDSVGMCPVNDIFSALVFSLGEREVDTLFVRGREVLRKGELTTIDEELVKAKVRERWTRLTGERDES